MATSEGTEASECGDAGWGGDLVVSGAWSGAFRFRPGAIVGLVWGGTVVRWKGRLLQAVAITTYLGSTSICDGRRLR
jgi:hypothetical protein